MSSFSSSSSSNSSGSSFSIQYKLAKIWKTIQYVHPLLACLVDVETFPTAVLTTIDQIKLESEYILKELGTAIVLRLLQMESRFYIHLSAKDAQVWSEIPPSQNNEQTAGVTTENGDSAVETTEMALVDESNKNLTESDALHARIFRLFKWPTTIYSVIKMALENFTSTPRYSKEACVLHSPSSVIDSTLSITRGEILCIKIYRPSVWGTVLTSFYHFGVYVGTMTTKNGRQLEHAVIDLTKTNEEGAVRIRAIPLEGLEKDKCFVMKKTKSGRPPLLFKVIYGERTQKEKDEIVDRALEFYNNSEHYLQKYSLFSNNCEHFVNVCAFGKPHCDQHFRAILTVLPGFLKVASPAVSQTIRFVLITITEIIEATSKAASKMSYLGEAVALGMLIIEYAFRIFWDIYLLKQSGRLTARNVRQLVKRHTLSMAPEAIAAIGFLLVALLCTFTGPVGLIIGISGAVVLVLLRLIARPRIARWIEERETARLEDFLQWHPNEVARLAMEILEEDDDHEEIVQHFESKELSGKKISELVNQERDKPFENILANALEFLEPNRLTRFKQNLKGIFGHFDISEQLKSAIRLTYNKRTISIEIPDMSTFTVQQLLDMARVNWQVNFTEGEWQVKEIDPDDQSERIIASSTIPKSKSKEIETVPDSPTQIELFYKEPECTLL